MTNAETAKPQSPEQMPTLAEIFPIPEEARSLDRFIGTWAVDGALTVEGTPLRMIGEWTFAPAAAGRGVRASLRAEIDGMGTYEEDDLVGYDVESGTFHIYSLTNSAAVHDHVAAWTGPDVMEFDYEGLQGGKPYREVGRVEFLAPNRLQVESTDYVEGEMASSMSATLSRRS